jgi:hypothetical protein
MNLARARQGRAMVCLRNTRDYPHAAELFFSASW